MSETILETLAQSLLDVATEALPEPPDRSYIAHGDPAWDCGQLTVHLFDIHPKIFLDPMVHRCSVVPVARWRITLVDCVAQPDNKGNPPKADVLRDESLRFLNSAWRLWKTLTTAWKDGAFGNCQQVNFLPLTPAPPQGGLAGFTLDIEIELTGAYPAEGE